MIETAMLSFGPDPARLLAQFRSDDTRRVLAARVEGTIRSAFDAGSATVQPPPAALGPAPEAKGGSRTAADEQDASPPMDSADDGAPHDGAESPEEGRGPFAPEPRVPLDDEPDTADPAGGAASSAPAAAPSPQPAAPSPSRSTAPAAIIVVADADLLADQNWIVEERLGPISLGARTIADNGAFVLNALEMLSGDDSLLALRGRGSATRPFGRVEAIRKSAEARYLAREQELQDQIAEAQRKINELQRAKPAEGRGQLILSPEQERELDKLEKDILEARRELRQVQFNLRSDVEELGTRLMVVNVVAWPLMVALAAMVWTVHRSHRAGRSRRHAKGGRP